MKTISFYLSAGLLVTLLAFHTQITNLFKKENSVSKNISLAVYTNNDYTSKEYENSVASVKLTVIKIEGENQKTVWEKNLNELSLKDYPQLNNAITESVSIPNIRNSKDKLAVIYTITYNTKGSVLQATYGELISNTDVKVLIKI
ncbi:MAG: hypothetical protein ACR2FN_00365 [Chitinophagaceae bacterium]